MVGSLFPANPKKHKPICGRGRTVLDIAVFDIFPFSPSQHRPSETEEKEGCSSPNSACSPYVLDTSTELGTNSAQLAIELCVVQVFRKGVPREPRNGYQGGG